MRFVDSGVLPSGGVRVRVKSPEVSGSASRAAACLARSLQGAPHHAGDRWQFVARDVAAYETRALMTPAGLLIRSPDHDTSQEPRAVDQGLGVLVRLGVGDEAGAYDLVAAILHHFDSRRLWGEPPVQTAVLLRSLLRYAAITAHAESLAYVDEFLHRLWWQGRDGEGWFVGPADPTPTLAGQAALAGLLAARALRPEIQAQVW